MKKMTLGMKLIFGGVAVVLIPLLVVGIFAAVKSSGALDTAAKSQSVHIAKRLSQMVNNVLESELKFVAAIAVDETIAQSLASKSNGIDKKLQRIMKTAGQGYEAILVLDNSGNVKADSNNGEYAGLSVGERDYFVKAKSGKIAIGEPVKSKKTGKPTVSFCAPVASASGDFLGAVLVVMKTDVFVDEMIAVKVGDTGYPFMTDTKGLIIAHPKKEFVLELNLTTQAGMKEIMDKMLAKQTGSMDYVFQGVKKIAGFSPVDATGWSVCVTQNADEFLAASHSIRNFILIIGAIFLAVTVLAVFFFSQSITKPISRAVNELNEAANQVSSASGQVSQASQSLAEGASESASSLEETSSSLEEMTSMTRQNADHATQAKSLMAETKQIVEKVDAHMNQMAQAMADVTKTSEDTGKIIKTIDEIAFQTNLLALNAAVEAARVGEAGAGFAVVADEVRNLAMRAAEAAKNTSVLIENTLKSVKNGNELTKVTHEAFKGNVEISVKVGNIIDEIAAASQEQAQGIQQINIAVSEMDKVTQGTAANAEESASAAEEMNAQAEQMKDVVRGLVDVIGGSANGNGAGHVAKIAEGAGGHVKRSLAAAVKGVTKPKLEKNLIPMKEGEFKDF